MNTKHFLHLRPQSTIPTTEYRMNGFHDLHAATKKALERWENEGGTISELPLANVDDRLMFPAETSEFRVGTVTWSQRFI